MKIETFSIVAGSLACDAICPFCIAEMTPDNGVPMHEPQVNWRNFDVACRLAKQHGVTTALITGKGEPTLFPEQVEQFIKRLYGYKFPFIELQTNGYRMSQNMTPLILWYAEGLTTVALSVVHWDPERNRQIYMPHRKSYYDLGGLIDKLHKIGYSVRVCCMMVKDFIDSYISVDEMINHCRTWGVEQLTFRPIVAPDRIFSESTALALAKTYVYKNAPDSSTVRDIYGRIRLAGEKLLTMPYGAEIYDVNGQNVCLSNCLTSSPNSGEIRQLIFFPDGHLRYDWRYKGATLL